MADILVDGNTRVDWVTTLSSLTSPTATQLNAGVNLTGFLPRAGVKGLEADHSDVDTSSLLGVYDTTSFGTAKVNPELTLKRQGTDTAYTTFAGEPAGFLVVRRGIANNTAYVAGQKVDVYTMKASLRKKLDPAGNEVEKFTVKLGNQADPAMDSTVA